MSSLPRDVYTTPLCPPGCSEVACREGRHERVGFRPTIEIEFTTITMRLRSEDDSPLTFMLFAGIALIVNSERRSSSAVPLNWFEACTTCGETAACDCEPNILAILAQEEGGSEWQS